MLKINQKQDERKEKYVLLQTIGKTLQNLLPKNVVDHKKQCWQKFKVEKLPIFSSLKMKSSVITQQSHNVVKTLRQCRNFVQPIHSVETTLMSQRQNNNVVSTLPQR